MKIGIILLIIGFVSVLVGLGIIVYKGTRPAKTIEAALSELGAKNTVECYVLNQGLG